MWTTTGRVRNIDVMATFDRNVQTATGVTLMQLQHTNPSLVFDMLNLLEYEFGGDAYISDAMARQIVCDVARRIGLVIADVGPGTISLVYKPSSMNAVIAAVAKAVARTHRVYVNLVCVHVDSLEMRDLLNEWRRNMKKAKQQRLNLKVPDDIALMLARDDAFMMMFRKAVIVSFDELQKVEKAYLYWTDCQTQLDDKYHTTVTVSSVSPRDDQPEPLHQCSIAYNLFMPVTLEQQITLLSPSGNKTFMAFHKTPDAVNRLEGKRCTLMYDPSYIHQLMNNLERIIRPDGDGVAVDGVAVERIIRQDGLETAVPMEIDAAA